VDRTLFGFYDLDASPQRGLPGELATRLGRATETEGFVDGALYVRSDNLAAAIQMQYVDEDGWEDRGGAAILLQAADWRSRSNDVDRYRLAKQVEGDGDAPKDSTFFIVQRFVVDSSVCAQPIPGFLAGDAYASLDGTKVVFVMPWAHEAALASLENRDGSLEAMQKHLKLSKAHVFSSYSRVSYLRAVSHADAASASRV
jgi:hypothetical protein